MKTLTSSSISFLLLLTLWSCAPNKTLKIYGYNCETSRISTYSYNFTLEGKNEKETFYGMEHKECIVVKDSLKRGKYQLSYYILFGERFSEILKIRSKDTLHKKLCLDQLYQEVE